MFERIKRAMRNGEEQEQFLINDTGKKVPLSQIKKHELARHELVMKIADDLIDLRGDMVKSKHEAAKTIDDFLEKAFREYGVGYGGQKGGVTLTSFDGKYKIQRQMSNRLDFDERILAAKTLIDECIVEWSVGASREIKTLVDDAFDVDKQGKLNMQRILGLRRLEIKNDKWQQAMEAISDSIRVVNTKSYIRLYEKQSDGSYKHLPLDMSCL